MMRLIVISLSFVRALAEYCLYILMTVMMVAIDKASRELLLLVGFVINFGRKLSIGGHIVNFDYFDLSIEIRNSGCGWSQIWPICAESYPVLNRFNL